MADVKEKQAHKAMRLVPGTRFDEQLVGRFAHKAGLVLCIAKLEGGLVFLLSAHRGPKEFTENFEWFEVGFQISNDSGSRDFVFMAHVRESEKQRVHSALGAARFS